MSSAVSPDALANEVGRRRALGRFGYQPEDTRVADHDEIWRRLRSDFPATTPDLAALPADALSAAVAYCAHRQSLDRSMDRCDAVHMEIVKRGPDPALVETYAAARDAYEDAVERFGELRLAVDAALRAGAPG